MAMKLILEYAILSVSDVKLARVGIEGKSYQFTIEYIDEWGKEKVFACSSDNLPQIKGDLDEVKKQIPLLQMRKINDAIMSE